MKTYRELSRLTTFKERFSYLQIRQRVGDETFGSERWLNQRFYTSVEWKRVRDEIITRDLGCDMGLTDYPVMGPVTIHHINPLRREDLYRGSDRLMDPDNLISVHPETHRKIHYGDSYQPTKFVVERFTGDTIPWR